MAVRRGKGNLGMIGWGVVVAGALFLGGVYFGATGLQLKTITPKDTSNYFTSQVLSEPALKNKGGAQRESQNEGLLNEYKNVILNTLFCANGMLQGYGTTTSGRVVVVVAVFDKDGGLQMCNNEDK